METIKKVSNIANIWEQIQGHWWSKGDYVFDIGTVYPRGGKIGHKNHFMHTEKVDVWFKEIYDENYQLLSVEFCKGLFDKTTYIVDTSL